MSDTDTYFLLGHLVPANIRQPLTPLPQSAPGIDEFTGLRAAASPTLTPTWVATSHDLLRGIWPQFNARTDILNKFKSTVNATQKSTGTPFRKENSILGACCAVPPPYAHCVAPDYCLYPTLDLATPQRCRFTRSIQSSDIVDKCLLYSVVCSDNICRTAPSHNAAGETG